MKWWNDLPATVREPIKSFAVSSAFGLQSVFVAIMSTGFVDGQCGSPAAAWSYLGAHWWAGIIGVFFGVGPYYRARQGALLAAKSDPFALPSPEVLKP